MPAERICFVTSEVVPFSKTGGLADVSGALPKYLTAAGLDVRIITPLYASIDRSGMTPVDYAQDVPVRFDHETVHFSLYISTLPGSPAPVYFVDCGRMFGRSTIYTDHDDEYLRFAMLSRASLESCQRMGWSPDVIHCHDWQTALIPLLLRTQYAWDALFQRSRTMLTIHNIGYQGVFHSGVLDALGLAGWSAMILQEDYRAGVVNYLKTGILYADILTTVSATYAREIQTPEYGAGLDGLLRSRSNALAGIVNGVDYSEWSPESDELIPYDFSPDEFEGKAMNKRDLMAAMQLPYDPKAPVLGIISRLTPQKGFDLMADVLPYIVHNHDVRLVVLGSGDARYEEFFTWLHHNARHKVCFYNGFSNELAHLIEAGSDVFLMPSHYEPCGLNQIYSLRYGTVPVVRRTGGLADTVQQYDPSTGTGTGFLFDHYDTNGLRWAIETAIHFYHDKLHWDRIVRNAMAQDFSWERQVGAYLALYDRLAG
jgi:starch synthase